MAERIVVGYDGSEGAKRALDRAADLAGYGSTVTVVTVAQPVYRRGLTAIADPRAVEDGKRLLDDACRRIGAHGVSAHALERVGEPAEELLAAARDLRADVLVVGDGKGSVERLVFGSVSTDAVHHAPCDVLVVRGRVQARRAEAD